MKIPKFEPKRLRDLLRALSVHSVAVFGRVAFGLRPAAHFTGSPQRAIDAARPRSALRPGLQTTSSGIAAFVPDAAFLRGAAVALFPVFHDAVSAGGCGCRGQNLVGRCSR